MKKFRDDVEMNHVNALLQIRDTMRHRKRDLAWMESDIKGTLVDTPRCAELVRSCPKTVNQFFYHIKGLNELFDTFEEWSVQALEELKEEVK